MEHEENQERRPRSKDRHVGNWSNCVQCGERFASFTNKTGWIQVCSLLCSTKLRAAQRPPKVLKIRAPRIRNVCATCGKNLTNPTGRNCLKCFSEKRERDVIEKMEALTLDMVVAQSAGYKNRHAYQKIRNHADKVISVSGVPKQCIKCGSLNGVQICHIKGIATFDRQASVATINHISNLVCLCPSHHWELDHGLLVL